MGINKLLLSTFTKSHTHQDSILFSLLDVYRSKYPAPADINDIIKPGLLILNGIRLLIQPAVNRITNRNPQLALNFLIENP